MRAPRRTRTGLATLSVLGGFREGELIGPGDGASFILAVTEDARSETPIEEDNWVAAAEWADGDGRRCDQFVARLSRVRPAVHRLHRRRHERRDRDDDACCGGSAAARGVVVVRLGRQRRLPSQSATRWAPRLTGGSCCRWGPWMPPVCARRSVPSGRPPTAASSRTWPRSACAPKWLLRRRPAGVFAGQRDVVLVPAHGRGGGAPAPGASRLYGRAGVRGATVHGQPGRYSGCAPRLGNRHAARAVDARPPQ